MHELSIAQSIVEQAEQIAQREQMGRVIRITVTVGALSGVDGEALTFAFPFASENTMAGGAELIVESIPARVRCGVCSKETCPDPPFFLCGACGSDKLQFVSGRELHIKSVELSE